MNEENEEYKSLLIVNESKDAVVTLYIYRTCINSKIIQPNEKYFHREKTAFKYKLVASFDDNRVKKEFPGPLEWTKDTLIRITESLECIEENLADYPLEKQICLPKMNFRTYPTSTSGKVNLYGILGLDMTEVRKMNIGDQKIAINEAFRDQIKIWHPDKNCGDGEIAMQIILARETLLDDERRARYHNEADYDEGWLSPKFYKSIFWPDCYTEKQNKAYWRRVGFVAISYGLIASEKALTGLTAVAVPPYLLIHAAAVFGGILTNAMAKKRADNSFGNETREFHETSEEGTALEPQKATFRYKSEGKWRSKMIVIYLLNGNQIKREADDSGGIVKIPSDARQVEVRFQVRRSAWQDVMKYDRFNKKWYKPHEPHVFCYETPPLERTFTISCDQVWVAVMRVSDEHHEETGEMVGYLSPANVKRAGK